MMHPSFIHKTLCILTSIPLYHCYIVVTFEMTPYKNQIGGHEGTLFEHNGHILKPTSQKEVDFYLQAQNYTLKKHIPVFCKSISLDLPDHPNVITEVSIYINQSINSFNILLNHSHFALRWKI